MDNQSITHTRWNCTYHIVFIPKFRRKIMYGETKKDLVEIIKKLCEMKQVQLIDGKVCVDHVHMYVAIPPKMCVVALFFVWQFKENVHLLKESLSKKTSSFYYFDEEGYAGIYN